MNKLIVKGGHRLSGEITIGGAKNSTVALIPAAILADTPVRFDSVPDILDVHNLMVILESMNVKSDFTGDVLTIDPTNIEEGPLPSKAIKSLRASYYFMGALLGRFHRAVVTFPGGDNIGPRPIDQHIKAFRALGAEVTEKDGTVTMKTGEDGFMGLKSSWTWFLLGGQRLMPFWLLLKLQELLLLVMLPKNQKSLILLLSLIIWGG